MPRGGSKPGERRGGRQKGAANKRTAEIANRAALEGITPLEVMIKVMRDAAERNDWPQALNAAEKAAPYMHARLAATTLSGPDGGPVEHTVEVVEIK